jgi:hypothetical protein
VGRLDVHSSLCVSVCVCVFWGVGKTEQLVYMCRSSSQWGFRLGRKTLKARRRGVGRRWEGPRPLTCAGC